MENYFDYNVTGFQFGKHAMLSPVFDKGVIKWCLFEYENEIIGNIAESGSLDEPLWKMTEDVNPNGFAYNGKRYKVSIVET